MDGRNLLARKLLILGCSSACLIVLVIILGHPETDRKNFLLGLPSKFIKDAFAATKELNSRSAVLQNDLEKLAQDLNSGSSNAETDSSQNPSSKTLKRSIHSKQKSILHEGYSEDVQRKAEDIEEESKGRIESGEWTPEIVRSDQVKGFLPNTSEKSENALQLLVTAEKQEETRLDEEYEAKKQALKRIFNLRESLLKIEGSESLASRPVHQLPQARPADELVGPSGLIVGDGTHLRKDTMPVGVAVSNKVDVEDGSSLYQLWETGKDTDRMRNEQYTVDEPIRRQPMHFSAVRREPNTINYARDYNFPSSGQVERGDEWDNRADCGMWGGNC